MEENSGPLPIFCPDCGSEDFNYEKGKGAVRSAWCAVCGHELTAGELVQVNRMRSRRTGGGDEPVQSGGLGSRLREALGGLLGPGRDSTS